MARDIAAIWPWVATAAIGVFPGTLLGTYSLGSIPRQTLRRTVAVLLLALGVYMM
jgi:uncharacterized membrane protein YfcA